MAAAEKIITIQPGVYDIDINDYHNGEGLGSSAIICFKNETPKHYWDKYKNPNKPPKNDKNELIFGNAFHTYILEPEKFNEKYVVAPKINRATKQGKMEYANFMEENKGKILIASIDLENIKGMADSLHEDEAAYSLTQNAKIEKSIYWRDEQTNLLCKCRPDIWHDEDELIVDLKTTLCASKSYFKHSIKKYRYDIQAAYYLDGQATITNKHHNDFIHIAVEKTRPWPVSIYQIKEDEIEEGRAAYKEVLINIKKCMDENKWPGYGEGVQEISVKN